MSLAELLGYPYSDGTRPLPFRYRCAQGLGWPRHGRAEPHADPAYVAAVMSAIPQPGPVQDGLGLPHWPPFEDDQVPHQLHLDTVAGGDLALGCTCGAAIETRSCWAASDAIAAWKAWHEREGNDR